MQSTQLVDEINEHTAEELPDFIKEMGGAVPVMVPDNYTGVALPESQPPPPPYPQKHKHAQNIRGIDVTEDLYLKIKTTGGEEKTYENWSNVLFSEEVNEALDKFILAPNTPKFRSFVLKAIYGASSDDQAFFEFLKEVGNLLVSREQD